MAWISEWHGIDEGPGDDWRYEWQEGYCDKCEREGWVRLQAYTNGEYWCEACENGEEPEEE